MLAYVVFTRERMRNREEYERYREKSRPVNAAHPLKPLALYGKNEVLEGPAMEGAVILEFPTVEATKAYYHSPGYQDALSHRLLGADSGSSSSKGLKGNLSFGQRPSLPWACFARNDEAVGLI